MQWLRFGLSLAMALGHLCGCGKSGSQNSSPGAVGSAGVGMPNSEEIQKTVEPPNALGFAKVRQRGPRDEYREGVVDRNGKEIVPLSTQLLVDDITDGMALVRLERKFLFVPLEYGPYSDEDLASVNGFQYAQPYRCGLAMVMMNDDCFYIRPDGQPAFDETYNFAETFEHDRAHVAQGHEHRLIDPTGRTIASLPYKEVTRQTPYCWRVGNVEDGNYVTGFVDLNGNPIGGLIYDDATFHDEDVQRTWVRQGAKYGYLDEYGKVAIPIQYEYAEIFSQGKAWVQLNGRQFAIDRNGKEVVD